MTPGELTSLALFAAFTWGGVLGAIIHHQLAAKPRSAPRVLFGARSDDP
jgi:hypothetical protein